MVLRSKPPKQTKTKKKTLENLITGRYGPVKSKQTRQGWKQKKTTVQQKLGRKKEKKSYTLHLLYDNFTVLMHEATDAK